MSDSPIDPAAPDGAPAPLRADARRNRDLVVAAAVRVLSERPDASMREIAEASGVGRTTVYRHFPQRDDLVRALFRRVFEEAHEIAERFVAEGRAAWAAGDGDGLEVVVALTAEFADIGERYRFLGVHRELEAEQLEALSAEHGTEPLESYLAEAQARGELRTDLTVPWMMDVVHGLTMMAAQHVRLGAGTVDELRPMLAATVRGALGPARD
ncbi:helix-turn-helix domain-containing protein [Patulibacter sp. NPDC049589]|uniref:TetR/AcrR family transcriptional regulator n=1 Tax=Patulibacter sp. NPDC049589 TaxID=3154731 RepID=UPI00342B5BB8